MFNEQIIFYGFSTVLIFASLMVVVAGNPVRCALFLVLAFFASAALWILLEAEFLALVLILVYVGAVMTLFLFVIMMMQVTQKSVQQRFVRYLPMGFFAAIVLVGLMIFVIGPEQFGLGQFKSPTPEGPEYSNVKELGSVLYTEYAYPFILAGVLLLIAMISAISLSLRGPQNRRGQRPAEQIAVQRDDRIRMVKMKSEKKV